MKETTIKQPLTFDEIKVNYVKENKLFFGIFLFYLMWMLFVGISSSMNFVNLFIQMPIAVVVLSLVMMRVYLYTEFVKKNQSSTDVVGEQEAMNLLMLSEKYDDVRDYCHKINEMGREIFSSDVCFINKWFVDNKKEVVNPIEKLLKI